MITESNDPLLTLVGTISGSVGALARAFLDRDPAQEPEWLDEWFLGLVEEFLQDPDRASKSSAEKELREEDLAKLTERPASKRVRILSIHPKHFRGFRNCPNPVDLRGDLVVIEGRNSTGKTSLSEALEWLITGVLSRRASGDLGHPRESADCIVNAFRPPDEETSVTAQLEVDGKEITLERVLVTDYSGLAHSLPESRLRLGGQDLSTAEELGLQEDLFCGVPPILLQQTLRQFIHAQPAERRKYFERLLRIDEITALIEKAVVGDAGLKDFPPPSGSRSVEDIKEYRNSLGGTPASLALKKVEDSSPEDASALLEGGLVEVARESFSQLVEAGEGFSECRKSISDAQAKTREAQLPILGSLRVVSGASKPHLETTKKTSADLIAASARFSTARAAAKTIDESKLAIASAFQELVQVGLVNRDIEGLQVCPICEAFEPSLTPERVTELGEWIPLSQAVETARREKNAALLRANESLSSLDRQLQVLKPPLPTDSEFELQINGFQKKTADVAKTAYVGVRAIKARCEEIQKEGAALKKLFSADPPDGDSIREQIDKMDGGLGLLNAGSKALQKTGTRLEALVGSSAEEDPEYRDRAQWLRVASLRDTLEQDLKWEVARKAAQGRLEETRAALISLRTRVIKTSTTVFSKKITEIWGLLRKDAGASFGRLHIPPPRGKGFKLELEVKAEIDDGSVTKEVDALRVFSESQMNVVGIAAFVTRVRLLGQSLLILDDPVQSMDEEHHRSLGSGLLGALCDDGLQVIVLTHSDQFARDVSHAHFTREGYVTLATRYSRRNGCVLDEGNRRVAERLRQAEKLGEEGDLDKAWIRVRTAIERLFLVLRLKNDPKFEPESWRNATAEEMWNQGVAELVERVDPAAGARLKDILALTVAGAHDKHSRGQTDLNEAVGFIRSLLNPLRVGEG